MEGGREGMRVRDGRREGGNERVRDGRRESGRGRMERRENGRERARTEKDIGIPNAAHVANISSLYIIYCFNPN